MDLGLLVYVLVLLLIAGVIIWAIRALAAALRFPPVLVIVAQVVVALILAIIYLPTPGDLVLRWA